ncbi:hypothetical protein EGR_05646 [Echinococcus granulosus]|uniref:Uncharacterized protein n=1 Tax=Echinococcus granulosus TaxID=6210 RepID=W6UF49_ECHGR|nr:hypothetical protein EGR_05646 [Echinococcus granulosus]EUB59496.1 hypothetical protein EGR_05646 [Echinococcus granulosus]
MPWSALAPSELLTRPVVLQERGSSPEWYETGLCVNYGIYVITPHLVFNASFYTPAPAVELDTSDSVFWNIDFKPYYIATVFIHNEEHRHRLLRESGGTACPCSTPSNWSRTHTCLI